MGSKSSKFDFYKHQYLSFFYLSPMIKGPDQDAGQIGGTWPPHPGEKA
jgi:hypothetical protein